MCSVNAPELNIVLAFEESPVVRLVADTAEDEQRLRAWASHPRTRVRLTVAIFDALELVAREAA